MILAPLPIFSLPTVGFFLEKSRRFKSLTQQLHPWDEQFMSLTKGGWYGTVIFNLSSDKES